MRFALNYSPEAVALRQSEQITLDLFKVPDWKDLINDHREQLPLYVHFSLFSGNRPGQTIDWDMIEWALDVTHTPYVNVHLGVWHDVIPGANILDVSPATVEQVRRVMLEGLEPFIARFGADRVMGENLFAIDRKGEVMQAGTLPHVLTSVIEETGIGLLLDTAHAKMAAFSQGIPVHDYVNALPVERLREVHVTGIGYRDDGRLGDHLPMRADDWALYEWVMDQVHHNPRWAQPDIVACEYGGVGEMFRPYSRADVIAEQIPRMHRAVFPQTSPTL